MNLMHPSACLTHGLMRTARTLARGFEAEVAGLDLTAPQFTVLSWLAGTGPMTVGQVAATVDADRTTISRNLTVMADKGWIAESAAKDRRERLWDLTDAGRAILNKATPIWQTWQARLVHRIGTDAAVELTARLKSIAPP